VCLCNTRIRKYWARNRKAPDREGTGLLFASVILFQGEGVLLPFRCLFKQAELLPLVAESRTPIYKCSVYPDVGLVNRCGTSYRFFSLSDAVSVITGLLIALKD
jgi:hypothetical protein